MERLLARLERRMGKLAIPRLPFVIAVTSAVVYALGMLRPMFMFQLLLIPQLVMAGQVWRVITWVFVPPPSGNLFWTAIAILFYLSFMPTFMDLRAITPVAYVEVCAVIAVVSLIVMGGYATLAARGSARFTSNPVIARRLQKGTGGLLIGAGAAVALKST